MINNDCHVSCLIFLDMTCYRFTIRVSGTVSKEENIDF
jgi:hypothetical protein